jgi:hypothetical protein
MAENKPSDKDILGRAARELQELKGDMLELLEDHDIYWKVQGVIQSNARLLTTHSSFFDMMNDGFAYSAAVRVRRIVDEGSRTVSLLRLLNGLKNHPKLGDGDELRRDIQELKDTTAKIKKYVDQVVAHRDRMATADIPKNRELTAAIETISGIFRKYYGIVLNTDVDLQLSHLTDPLEIFRFPWIAPALKQS